MTEPKRLLESASGECDSFEADLLRAGRGDAMSASAKRALVAAALGGSLAVSAGAHATAHAATAAKVGTSVFAKWMVVGILGSVVVAGAALLLTRAPAPVATGASPSIAEPAAEARPAAPSAVAPSAVAPSAAPHEPPAAAVVASAPPAAIGSAPAPSAQRAAAPSSTAAPPLNAPDDLAAEAALLDEARDAVARRDGAAAIAVLAEHGRKFPRPSLADEAFVIRVEALSVQGDGARVRALATPWLTSHPTSPYAPRVRRALAQASPGEAP